MMIEIVPAYDHPQEVCELFTEYTDMLVAGAPAFAKYLEKQHFAQEVKDLGMKYGRPEGRLYLAYCDGQVAGCIGLKKLDAESCEIKRLYVRPAFRGAGLARKLVNLILEDARQIGYQTVLLDTLPFLKEAIHLYDTLGFTYISSYNNSPMEGLIYMKLDL